MAEERKSKLELVTEVFDGWDNVPVASQEVYNGKEWVSPSPEGEFVPIKGNPLLEEPQEAFYWNIEHGCTGWFNVDWTNKGNYIPRKMGKNTVYAVPRKWYEENK